MTEDDQIGEWHVYFIGTGMLRLTEPQIDHVIAYRGAFFLSGLALMALPFALPRGWGCGLFSGFMLASLGTYGFVFRKWRTEPGLWMLAVFLTVTLGPCWAYFEVLHWQEIFTQPAARVSTWDQLRLVIDAFIALMLFANTVKFAFSVAIENWRRTRVRVPALGPSSPFKSESDVPHMTGHFRDDRIAEARQQQPSKRE